MSHLVVTGAAGNIGRRVMAAHPQAIGIDRVPGCDIQSDLSQADLTTGALGAALSGARTVLHLAADADPQAGPETHLAAALLTARLVAACAGFGVPRLVLASSLWADPAPPHRVNPYGHSKRVAEAFAAIYDALPGLSACALRLGWVPGSPEALARAPHWLRDSHWPDDRLLAAVDQALYPRPPAD